MKRQKKKVSVHMTMSRLWIYNIAYEYFPLENKDVKFCFTVLILVGEKDSTSKVKAYCSEWSKR